MKQFAIFLTAALFGVMGWLVMDARNRATAAELKLELHQQRSANQQAAQASTLQVAPAAPVAAPAPVAPAPAPVPSLPSDALESAVREKALVNNFPNAQDLDPNSIPEPMGTPGMQIADPAAVAAAPAPEPTVRQRLVTKANLLGNVQEYAKEHGFLIVTPKEGALFTEKTSYSIRRGDAVIAKIRVSAIEEGNVIADLDPGTLAPGLDVVVGDEVIQDLGGNSRE